MDTKIAGKMGGLATAKRGASYYRKIQKKSVASRLINTSIKKGLQLKQEGI